MAGAAFIVLGIAIFFAMCWAIGNFEGWRFRAAEIGVPLLAAVLFYAFPHDVPAPRYAGIAFLFFAAAALIGALRPFFGARNSFNLVPRLFYRGSTEGLSVYIYAALFTLALAGTFSALTGISVLP